MQMHAVFSICFVCGTGYDTGGDRPMNDTRGFCLDVDGGGDSRVVVAGLYCQTPPVPFKADLGLWC